MVDSSKFSCKSHLSSGIKVLTESIPYVRSVALGFWVNVGARDELSNLSGISHFIEHLVFKGTKDRTARQISEGFDRLGAEFNAFSAKEYTCFYTRLLDEHLPRGVEILSDVLQNPLFAKDDIEAERKVVLEEINLYEDTPDELIHDLFASTLFKNYPLGKPILGSPQTVKTISQASLKSYFRKRFNPANIVVAAAGSLSHHEVVRLVKRYFADSSHKQLMVRKQVNPIAKRQVEVYQKKTEQAHICLGGLGVKAKDKNRFALVLLDNILGGGMSSRLFQEIREKRGLAYSIYSYHSFYTETGLFAIYAGANPNKVKEVLQLIQVEIAKIKENGISLDELKRAKEYIKGQLVLDLESTSHRMTRLGRSELVHGEILSLDELVERVDHVSLNDIKKMANSTFDLNKMALVIISPTKEEKILKELKSIGLN